MFCPVRILRCACLSLLLGWSALLVAQEPEIQPPAEKLTGDIIYLPGQDGELVPVPFGATLNGYLKWLQEQAAPPRDRPAAYSISSVSLVGTAIEDRAALKGRIAIQVTVDGEWVRIPLALPEVILRGSSHTGPGAAVADKFDPLTGYAWWLQGKGEHALELDFSVLLRRPATARRLQISLPATAVSSLKLRVPHVAVSARVAERAALSTRSVEKETEIEVVGLGNRLDLTWQPTPEVTAMEAALESATSISATLVEGETITLEALQRVQALQGAVEELRVALPPGYELLRVEGTEYQEHRADPANLNQVIVRLKRPIAGPVELKWTLRHKLPPPGTSLHIEGFEIERARIQTGFIAISTVGDIRLNRHPELDRFTQRIDIAQLPRALQQEQVSAGFQFLNQPFRLVLNLQPVDAHVGVEPHLFLHVTPQLLELDGTFQFSIYRGSVSEARLRWPFLRQHGWTIDSVEPAGRVEQVVSEEGATPEDDALRIRFSTAIKDEFSVRLRARRSLPQGSESFNLSLPMAEVPNPSATELIVLPADNLEVTLRASDTTRLRQLPLQAQPRIDPPREFQSLRRLLYRAETLHVPLTASLTTRPGEIKTESQVVATGYRDRVAVQQRIVYDVAYERVSQLRLLIPPELGRDQIEFLPEADVKLVPRWTKTDDNAPRELLLSLDESRFGRLIIQARYSVAHSGGRGGHTERTVKLPLIQSGDAVYSSVRFEWTKPAEETAAPVDADWVRQQLADGGTSWMLTGTKPAVALRLRREANSLNGLIISRCLIRTELDRDGSMQGTAAYRIGGLGTVLPISFSLGIVPTSFHWGAQRLVAAETGEDAAGNAHYEIDLPDRPRDDERVLVVRYRSQDSGGWSIAAHQRMSAPRLPPDLWISQTLWEVLLPANQHLFTEPANFTSQNKWQRAGLFWQRVPDATPIGLSDWIAGKNEVTALTEMSNGNRYVFASLAPAEAMSFYTMSQPGLVLIGAGLALVLGLLLIKVPAARHVLTVLSIGCAISFAGIWYTAPVLVLLQPAVLGLVLAIAAATIDNTVQKRRNAGGTVLTSPSGFAPVPSSINRELVVGIGSDEFTAARPALSSTADVGPPAESGSRA